MTADSETSHSTTTALMAALQSAYRERDALLRQTYDRSLPFADAVTDDRWERARRLGFGKGASIYNSALIFGEVTVGDGTWVGPSVILDGSGGLSVGSHCSISAHVQIYTHDSIAWSLTGGKAGYRQARTSIGSRCYIGPLSVIAAGVSIGDCSVVAANSFVNRDVPAHTIVGGSPARRLGTILYDGEQPLLKFDSGTETRPGEPAQDPREPPNGSS